MVSLKKLKICKKKYFTKLRLNRQTTEKNTKKKQRITRNTSIFRKLNGGSVGIIPPHTTSTNIHNSQELQGKQSVNSFCKSLLDLKKADDAHIVDALQINNVEIAIQKFGEYLKTTYNPNEHNIFQLKDKDECYDLCFLCSVMCILFNYTDVVNYIKVYNTSKIIINANDDVKCCDKTEVTDNDNKQKPKPNPRLKFFMEDFYTDDLEHFMREYEAFMVSPEKKSMFLFKSNIVNISMLLKCFQRRCFDTYFKSYVNNFKKRHLKRNNITNDVKLNSLFTVFGERSCDLVEILITAHLSYKYDDMCKLYIAYLQFYYAALGHSLNLAIPNVEDIMKTTYIAGKYIAGKNGNYTQTQKEDALFDYIINAIETSSSNNFIIYLACMHPAEYKQARIYMTRIIDSYIGGYDVHDKALISTLDVIGHDFNFHGNLTRIQNTQPITYDDINKKFIMELYMDNNKLNFDIYRMCMYILQILQNEKKNADAFTFTNKKTVFDYFLYVVNTDKYTTFKIDKYNTGDLYNKVLNYLSPGTHEIHEQFFGEIDSIIKFTIIEKVKN